MPTIFVPEQIAEAVAAGRKLQIIQAARRIDHIHVGDRLQFFTPLDLRNIGEGVCRWIGVVEGKWSNAEDYAKGEGFRSWEQMRRHYGGWPFKAVLVRWEKTDG